MSKMLDAFITQTYDPHEGIITYEEKCSEVVAKLDEIQSGWVKEAEAQLSRSQDISEYMTILSALQKDELNETTESHPKLAGYEHSLEMDRLTTLREKYDYVPPEPIAVDSADLKMSTEPYENINPEDVPSLNGLFDDVFGLN